MFVGDADDVERAKPVSSAALIAAAASVAAALLVHTAAAGTHSGDTDLVILFAVAAGVQALAAGLALVVPTKQTWLALAGVNTVAVVAWALSRTTGLPWPQALGDGRGRPATQDLVAAALAAVAAVTAGITVAAPQWSRPRVAPTSVSRGSPAPSWSRSRSPGMAAGARARRGRAHARRHQC